MTQMAAPNGLVQAQMTAQNNLSMRRRYVEAILPTGVSAPHPEDVLRRHLRVTENAFPYICVI